MLEGMADIADVRGRMMKSIVGDGGDGSIDRIVIVSYNDCFATRPNASLCEIFSIVVQMKIALVLWLKWNATKLPERGKDSWRRDIYKHVETPNKIKERLEEIERI
ncbi:hypothetical protein L1887_20327 [Cichorium endivia]|nr:hypothetical protein L1887_20327 [Cichorium endivia]